MFLAINEIKASKFRYSLIVGLLFLVAYLMFFLSGLAYGLIQENRSAIDLWKADKVILSKNANNTLNLSTLDIKDKEKIEAAHVSALAQMNTVVWNKKDPKESEKEKVSIFGINPNEFLKPKIMKGHAISSDEEVVIDQSLAKRSGFDIGDSLFLANSDQSLKIVGISQKATFNVSPVIYISLDGFQKLTPMSSGKYGNNSQKLNAFVVKGHLNSYDKEKFQLLSIKSFINKLPGYSAQIQGL